MSEKGMDMNLANMWASSLHALGMGGSTLHSRSLSDYLEVADATERKVLDASLLGLRQQLLDKLRHPSRWEPSEARSRAELVQQSFDYIWQYLGPRERKRAETLRMTTRRPNVHDLLNKQVTDLSSLSDRDLMLYYLAKSYEREASQIEGAKPAHEEANEVGIASYDQDLNELNKKRIDRDKALLWLEHLKDDTVQSAQRD
jgi:hypothetical protein